MNRQLLPNDLVYYIAKYLPVSKLIDSIEINRVFYHLGMSAKYESISIRLAGDYANTDWLTSLRGPQVCHRVKELCIMLRAGPLFDRLTATRVATDTAETVRMLTEIRSFRIELEDRDQFFVMAQIVAVAWETFGSQLTSLHLDAYHLEEPQFYVLKLEQLSGSHLQEFSLHLHFNYAIPSLEFQEYSKLLERSHSTLQYLDIAFEYVDAPLNLYFPTQKPSTRLTRLSVNLSDKVIPSLGEFLALNSATLIELTVSDVGCDIGTMMEFFVASMEYDKFLLNLTTLLIESSNVNIINILRKIYPRIGPTLETFEWYNPDDGNEEILSDEYDQLEEVLSSGIRSRPVISALRRLELPCETFNGHLLVCLARAVSNLSELLLWCLRFGGTDEPIEVSFIESLRDNASMVAVWTLKDLSVGYWHWSMLGHTPADVKLLIHEFIPDLINIALNNENSSSDVTEVEDSIA